MSDQSRVERAANLFDLRRIIGGVFVAWGVLLVILGIFDSEEEIEKAAGVNINLYAGPRDARRRPVLPGVGLHPAAGRGARDRGAGREPRG